MTINFIVNDPAVAGTQVQQISPSRNRKRSQPTFVVDRLPAEKPYAENTFEFVAWQAREAALRALGTFESFAGPLKGWMGRATRKKLNLFPDHGEDLNAYYDRDSISFFHFLVGNRTVFSGASTDVVAHETGHAILDALRPDLWNVNMMEVQAFHEGFGDCIAVMTALSDQATRQAILAGDADLSRHNHVEATAEELSAAIGKAISPNHNAAKPRHALNRFQWRLAQSLPNDGKPGVLIDEIHSFGQLTSGCFYDLIIALFKAGPGGEADLLTACRTATKLLAGAATTAPARPRFLETVGRTMLLFDQDENGGANAAFIRTAFSNHGITLSVGAFFAPRGALTPAARAGARRGRKAAAAPRRAATTLDAAAKGHLRSYLDLPPNTRIATQPVNLGGRRAMQVVGLRPVDLTGVSARLANVKAYTPQPAYVGVVEGTQALLGAVDGGALIANEVRDYVRGLVERDLIDFGGRRRSAKKAARKGAVKSGRKGSKRGPGGGAKRPSAKARRGRRSGAGFAGTAMRPTYAVKRVGREEVLERISFACGCARPAFACVSA